MCVCVREREREREREGGREIVLLDEVVAAVDVEVLRLRESVCE